jgi:glutamyl-tRNA synthetase
LGVSRELAWLTSDSSYVPRADGRFAPSPTGPLHVGNLRTALLAWLFARSTGGRFLVRVEDLDRSLVRAGVEEAQLADLRALGIDWDGPVVRQSERMALYGEAIASLEAGGLLYPCYCTRAENWASTSAPHGISSADRYPRTCCELTAKEQAEREASGCPPALRVRADKVRITFEDGLLVHYEGEVDYFAVRRNDGTPAYQLAVVADDAVQDVGEVGRGATSWTQRCVRSCSLGCSISRCPVTLMCHSFWVPTEDTWASATAR